jgi:putative spermidine/putrescine transport system ATP-binding protein
LLRLIAGLETPDSGSRILFGGEEVTVQPIEQRNIGMVFQSYALFPQMSVEANIGYGLRIRGVSQNEQRRTVGELVDLVRLNGLESKRPADLSGGQRQRVALARAVAVRPRVLLLDEPLSALDAKLKESLRDELAELLRRLHITAVHVTHDQQEALAIADRLAVMEAGRIVQIGDGETLYRYPGHPFVASFLGRVNRLQRDEIAMSENVLRVGGLTVSCPVSWADKSTLLVRPEDIQIGSVQADAGMAVVQSRSFFGNRVQLTLSMADHAPLQAEVLRDHPAKVGETVGIRISPDRLMSC